VCAGLIATTLGILLAAGWHRRRQPAAAPVEPRPEAR
jgi:hypothetical protein